MDYPKVDPEVCTGCGICVDSCLEEAITFVDDIATININKCVNCCVCINDCPNEAIS
jgi:ferredoxin